MRRVAFNRSFEIPMQKGTHHLYTLPEDRSLIFRIYNIMDSAPEDVIRIVIGDVVLLRDEIRPDLSLKMEPGQEIHAVCKASSVARRLQLCGFLEDHWTLRESENPFRDDTDLDSLLNQPEEDAIFGYALSSFNSDGQVYISTTIPQGYSAANLHLNIEYALSQYFEERPYATVTIEVGSNITTYDLSGNRPTEPDATTTASMVVPISTTEDEVIPLQSPGTTINLSVEGFIGMKITRTMGAFVFSRAMADTNTDPYPRSS